MNSYKELIVWQKSIELVKLIYDLTSLFPKNELFGIILQIRRAVVSIPSNIAEGYARRSHKEYLQFYSVAYGSDITKFTETENLLEEIVKMLYVMVYRERRTVRSVQ
ncbi:hypothetical protein A2778_02170 [Candidatus Daviesbacteria bacterium RIFCSPHIGHO2_01_FULL_40_24]|nr:MAG: hypothetical protein A2778_02170 [Candidatus Daviesbacteria bacterium RIFCSPHIGHO2_01_FULL_40_24]OGE28641.1 MAG: hypothetical protein A3C29_03280 [Candidatus Daviesbacteria bacterium RIFCSPHIGHO2_02_FULL_40_16]OGE43001.1 MAG: hypothetical protein A3A53_06760 [Candidatus Daviesbacteria bacterium RIFCSPLOWO2_01_FULL_39_23]OGE66499.1 MAG: hypothetical protein A3J16_05170 [Candidatus Daviesbacteria bacterium RIFCSPLOWO2_02_FULL_39_13]HCE31433.1 four helix bundle protein [Candidatus Daviesba